MGSSSGQYSPLCLNWQPSRPTVTLWKIPCSSPRQERKISSPCSCIWKWYCERWWAVQGHTRQHHVKVQQRKFTTGWMTFTHPMSISLKWKWKKRERNKKVINLHEWLKFRPYCIVTVRIKDSLLTITSKHETRNLAHPVGSFNFQFAKTVSAYVRMGGRPSLQDTCQKGQARALGRICQTPTMFQQRR